MTQVLGCTGNGMKPPWTEQMLPNVTSGLARNGEICESHYPISGESVVVISP